MSYSREGHTSFPKFFNENFCDVAFHFSYRLSFLFTYFDLIWSFILGTRLHFYMYIMPLHIVFLGGLVPFSVRIEKGREVLDSGIVSSASCCWLSAA